MTLYTGNDDHIVLDLLVPFAVRRGAEVVTARIRGGLLGHWSVWTQGAVALLERIHAAIEAGRVDADLLALDSRVTDCNSAFFDVANDFAGCIPGCHEVLRRQGLLQGIWCLDPNETLSPGQAEEITRVCREHADLADDAFVAAHLQRAGWHDPPHGPIRQPFLQAATRWACSRTSACCWPGTCSCASATCRSS